MDAGTSDEEAQREDRGDILVVDDEESIVWSLQRALSKEGYRVTGITKGAQVWRVLDRQPVDLMLLDIVLPDANGMELLKEIKEAREDLVVIMLTSYGDVDIAVQAMKLGAYDFIAKPFGLEEIRTVVHRALEGFRLKKELASLQGNPREKIIGNSLPMRKVFDMVQKIARCDNTTVLLEGESGTGKELIARAIHQQSRRGGRPFVEVNCTMLPDTLLESELLGHEKGAFTDAKSAKAGLFEQAQGGTLFLDEIGDIKANLQVKLLKLIEEKRVRRVGGSRDIAVDVRIVAATNQRLDQLVDQGRFRDDLYYRLRVFPIWVPPLRERSEDIPLLVEFFIDTFSRSLGHPVRGVAPPAMAALAVYPWPGNVRELKNVVERAMILAQSEELDLEDLPLELVESARARPEDTAVELPPEGVSLEQVERELICQALERTRGNQSQAARLLPLPRLTLRYRMEKHGLLHARAHAAFANP